MAKTDARRYRRISLNLPASITVNATEEFEGRLLNISPGDFAVISDAKVVEGDAVIIRISGLDEIEATVARILPDGFAASFILSKGRRTKLTEQLMLRVNEQYKDGLEDRRDTLRHRVGQSRAACRLADGTSLFVKIIDSSANGVSVEAPRRPALGSEIHVGRRRGVIFRHTPRGFVVVYEAKAQEETAGKILRAV